MLLQHGTKDQNEVFGEGGGSKRKMVKEAEEHVGTSYFEIVERRCMHAFSISSQSGKY